MRMPVWRRGILIEVRFDTWEGRSCCGVEGEDFGKLWLGQREVNW